ncbi:MAG: phosphodiester glycosidase family protein, partial [Bacteroidetes bacterium]|nr:phosphodiester glycosidase family protein [Bacteroidota bacterium]
MKKILTLLFAVTLHAFAFLSDTTSSKIVTEGVVHTKFLLSGPLTVDVLEVDLKNPNITLESYKPNGLTRTTVQSAANDRVGHRVIGAINADFFSFETGWPIDNQVVNGKVVLGLSSNQSHFALTEEKKPLIDGFIFNGKIFTKSGTPLTLNGGNTARGSNQTILFSSFKGATTGTDQTGQEIAVQVISPSMTVNDTLLVVVTQKGNGNLAIPNSGYVISGASGNPASFLTNNFSVNDTVKLYAGYTLRSGVPIKKITQLIGGHGRLIKDGVAYPTLGDHDGTGSGFNDVRHPRTFLGMNADSSKLFLCTVDGRQASSIGMTFTDMANFLLRFGVTNAFNLDGGGSTTMVVRGEVANSPSDPGGERSVANTLQIISSAPVGTLHYLNILEDRAEIFQGGTFKFHVEGRDEYQNPIALPSEIAWSADTAIGTIDSTGLFHSKIANDSGWVYVRYNSISDSVKVVVRVLQKIRIFPSILTMVPGEQLTFLAKGIDSDNRSVVLLNTQLTYQVNATNLNVSTDGIVTSTGFGSGSVTAKIDTLTFTIPYSSAGNDTTTIVEKFDDVDFWESKVTNPADTVISFSLSTDPVIPTPPAYRIIFNSLPGANAIMETTLPISSRPDTIRIKLYGDGGGHTVKLFFRDKDNQEFFITATSVVNWNNEWKDVVFRLVNTTPTAGGTVDFPITITKLQFTVGSTNLNNGKATDTIYVDNITLHYSNRAVAPAILYDFNSGITGW